MKNQKSDFDFSSLISEYKVYIYKDNGDLTVFGGLVFVFYGVALGLAIKKLQKRGKKL